MTEREPELQLLIPPSDIALLDGVVRALQLPKDGTRHEYHVTVPQYAATDAFPTGRTKWRITRDTKGDVSIRRHVYDLREASERDNPIVLRDGKELPSDTAIGEHFLFMTEGRAQIAPSGIVTDQLVDYIGSLKTLGEQLARGKKVTDPELSPFINEINRYNDPDFHKEGKEEGIQFGASHLTEELKTYGMGKRLHEFTTPSIEGNRSSIEG